MEKTEIIGLIYNITKGGVEKKLKHIEAEKGRAKYFAEIGGKK